MQADGSMGRSPMRLLSTSPAFPGGTIGPAAHTCVCTDPRARLPGLNRAAAGFRSEAPDARPRFPGMTVPGPDPGPAP